MFVGSLLTHLMVAHSSFIYQWIAAVLGDGLRARQTAPTPLSASATHIVCERYDEHVARGGRVEEPTPHPRPTFLHVAVPARDCSREPLACPYKLRHTRTPRFNSAAYTTPRTAAYSSRGSVTRIHTAGSAYTLPFLPASRYFYRASYLAVTSGLRGADSRG